MWEGGGGAAVVEREEGIGGGLEGTCVCGEGDVLRDLVNRGGEEIRKVSG